MHSIVGLDSRCDGERGMHASVPRGMNGALGPPVTHGRQIRTICVSAKAAYTVYTLTLYLFTVCSWIFYRGD